LTQFATIPKLETSFLSHSATLSEQNISADTINLSSALASHRVKEVASFHTPGHKGRSLLNATNIIESDLTELPELDELSYPQGVLQNLETKASELWGSAESIISVNGASAGLTAAILNLSSFGQSVLVPRNAHRAVINGLALSGLKPIWYEPSWNQDWQLFGAVDADSLKQELLKNPVGVAGVVVVSPTYAGSISDIERLSELCKEREIPLIVDEAHGAHLVHASAIGLGADIVVHSLHKTLSGMTQTGMVHIGKNSMISAEQMRANLRLLQSTSPSYCLMQSIEIAIEEISGAAGLARMEFIVHLSADIKDSISNISILESSKSLDSKFDVYSNDVDTACDELHILIKHHGKSAQELNDFLRQKGIFTETILGRGLLFMIGMGTNVADKNILIEALTEFASNSSTEAQDPQAESIDALTSLPAQFAIEAIYTPREASLMPSHSIPLVRALNAIAAETIAPCPPGIPLCIPGQRITQTVLDHLMKANSPQKVRVLVR
jgi:arginine decarboxylase